MAVTSSSESVNVHHIYVYVISVVASVCVWLSSECCALKAVIDQRSKYTE